MSCLQGQQTIVVDVLSTRTTNDIGRGLIYRDNFVSC